MALLAFRSFNVCVCVYLIRFLFALNLLSLCRNDIAQKRMTTTTTTTTTTKTLVKMNWQRFAPRLRKMVSDGTEKLNRALAERDVHSSTAGY